MNLFTRLLATGMVASLMGCATCREHPVACGVGVVFVAGIVAAAAGGSGQNGTSATLGAKRPVCSGGPC